MAAPALSPNGLWVYGDAPGGGISGFLARTAIGFREEPAPGGGLQTWVSTSQGVSYLFAGAQTLTIYNLIKDMTITVV